MFRRWPLSLFEALLLLGAGLPFLTSGCVKYQSRPLVPQDFVTQFEQRSFQSPGLREFATNFPTLTDQAWPPTQWNLASLTVAAFYFHPSLDVARAQWAVANGGVGVAKGRPNPVVGVTPGYSFNAASGTSPWFPLLSVDWPIEMAGKRGFRMARARHTSEAFRLNIVTTAWQVRSVLRVAFQDYTVLQRKSALLQSLLDIQQQMDALLAQRLAAGAVASPEVILSRIQSIKIGSELADMRRLVTEARARVAEAIGLPLASMREVEFAEDYSEAPEAAMHGLTPEDARNQALRYRPDLLAMLAEYAAIESSLQLEVARQYPDLHLGTGYQYDQGEQKWTLGLSAEIPVLNQNRGVIAETEAKRAESAARFLALQARVIAEIDRALANRSAVQDQLQRSVSLVAAQRQHVAAVVATFQAGGADQLELRGAQLEAAQAELAHLDVLLRAHQAVGQLEEALQQPLDGLSALERGRPPESTSKAAL